VAPVLTDPGHRTPGAVKPGRVETATPTGAATEPHRRLSAVRTESGVMSRVTVSDTLVFTLAAIGLPHSAALCPACPGDGRN